MRHLAIIGLVLSLSTVSFAQDLERAKDAFKEANDLHDKGDLKGALAKYKLANELGHTVTTVTVGARLVDPSRSRGTAC